ALGDPPVIGAAGRHLRRMCYDKYLQICAQPLQSLADHRRYGAADPTVDLVEDQGRYRGGAGENQFQRQHEARQLAPRSDASQWPEPRAGVGCDLEMHSLAAMLAPIRLGERCQHGSEPRLVEPQGLELSRYPRIEPSGRAGPPA